MFAREKQSHRGYCVFNRTRESFLSLNVGSADTHLGRLKGLVGQFRIRPDEGIWVTPSRGIHTIGVLFAIDLIYLNAEHRVIHLAESFGTFRIGPLRKDCCSVLELAPRTIYASQTHIGDELLICSPEEMQEFLKRKENDVQYKAASS